MDGGNDASGNPREAFSLLAHDVRLDILLALVDQWYANRTEPRGYSELMRAVDVEDSGKFNYHLDQLRGTYIQKVEDGYVPLASATALYRAVLANRPMSAVERAEFGVEATCPDCESELTATYEKEFLTVRCRTCASPVGRFTYPLPKNGFAGRDDDQVVAAVHRRAKYHVGLARTGQCPFCAGTTDVDVRADSIEAGDGFEVEVTCGTCSFLVQVDLLFTLLLCARVAGALVDIGVPVDEAYKWELPTPTTSVESRAPLRVALAVEKDGRTARVVVDDDLGVRSVRVDGTAFGNG